MPTLPTNTPGDGFCTLPFAKGLHGSVSFLPADFLREKQAENSRADCVTWPPPL